MALPPDLQPKLRDAIVAYGYPRVTFDFSVGREIRHDSMNGVERVMWEQLHSDNAEIVMDGLSNVLYWGLARIAYRDHRVAKFRGEITPSKLAEAQQQIRELSGTGLLELKSLKLPQFANMPFVSKLRMFLDPTNYVVLDKKILKIRNGPQRVMLDEIDYKDGDTAIRITKANARIYEKWCKLCRRIAAEYCSPSTRAVDVERGIFQLVDTGGLETAREIIALG